ncbi:MAG: hypothetical protein J6K19_07175 [Prevotella sp.]|nr:hypothetical protein [Prevotella sp.]
MARSLLEEVLRRAIFQGGKIGYNPDMYDYGFADNITPSEEFNRKLRKYGTLRYSSDSDLFGYGTIWTSFTIDERGRQYIKELDRHKDGPFKVKKIIRFFFKSFVFGFCLPIVIALGIEIGIAWLICNIDVTDSYSWISGLFHGVFIVPNFVRHLFNEDILYFAEYHTTAYTIFYWLVAILFILPPQIKGLFRLIIDLIMDWVLNKS